MKRVSFLLLFVLAACGSDRCADPNSPNCGSTAKTTSTSSTTTQRQIPYSPYQDDGGGFQDQCDPYYNPDWYDPGTGQGYCGGYGGGYGGGGGYGY